MNTLKMNSNPDTKPVGHRPGQVAAKWLLFLTFLHSIPSPFYLIMVAGLVPTAALAAGGLASLWAGDRESLFMGMWLSGPALVYGTVYYWIAWFLTKWICLIQQSSRRTVILVTMVVALLLMTLAPVYIIFGERSASFVSLTPLLTEFKIPTGFLIGYAALLLVVLTGLVLAQHTPNGLSLLVSRYPAWLIPGTRVRAACVAVTVLIIPLLSVYTNRAWLICEPRARAGQAWAQVCLARALTGRITNIQSDISAEAWYERAAAQGHKGAIRELLQLTRNSETRMKWLRVLAEAGDVRAQFELFALLRHHGDTAERRKEAFVWLMKVADHDHPQAQFELGGYYWNGKESGGVYADTVDRDREKSREWWERAAARGNTAAMKELAWRYEKGAEGFPVNPRRAGELWEAIAKSVDQGLEGSEGDRQTATEYRQRAAASIALQRDAERGVPEAQIELGNRLIDSESPSREDQEQALTLLERAAEQGDVETQYNLGSMYMFGQKGVGKDLEKGRKWWDRAVEQNHVHALEYVAEAHVTGQYGYPVDFLKARAQFEVLVAAYRDGRYGMAPDPSKAQYWEAALQDVNRRMGRVVGTYRPMEELRARAQAGDGEAQYQLAREVMPRDVDAGVALMHAAADGGFAEAQYYAGQRVRSMKSTPENLRRAVQWLTAAVAQGHRGAMYELGMVYLQGIKDIGLARDPARARALFEQALNGGGEVLYRYTGHDGHGWIVTAQQVQRMLERIP
jgi:TPR repeat protein